MKQLGTSRVLWSLIFAFAIIASAFVFKGKPANDWVEAGLIGLAVVFVVLRPARPASIR